MLNQAQVIVELLRMMIGGEHPVDLRLARHCTHKLPLVMRMRRCRDLMDKIELLDQAHLFNVPDKFMSSLRHEALHALEAAESIASHDEADAR